MGRNDFNACIAPEILLNVNAPQHRFQIFKKLGVRLDDLFL